MLHKEPERGCCVLPEPHVSRAISRASREMTRDRRFSPVFIERGSSRPPFGMNTFLQAVTLRGNHNMVSLRGPGNESLLSRTIILLRRHEACRAGTVAFTAVASFIRCEQIYAFILWLLLLYFSFPLLLPDP